MTKDTTRRLKDIEAAGVALVTSHDCICHVCSRALGRLLVEAFVSGMEAAGAKTDERQETR